MVTKKNHLRTFTSILWILLVVAHLSKVSAQEQEFANSPILTIESPSPKFKTLHLQSYKGIPRLGILSPFYTLDRNGKKSIDHKQAILVKGGYDNYSGLLGLKYFSDYFDDLDPDHLTVYTRDNKDDKAVVHSLVAQRMLKTLARNIGSLEQIGIYFCDRQLDRNCRLPNEWSASQDGFAIQEKYSSYVKENLENLRTWGNSLLPNDTLTAYHVKKYSFNPYGNRALPYDFDQEGFWIKTTFIRISRLFGFPLTFLPKTPFGNAHLNQINDSQNYHPKMLLKMRPDAAERLIESKVKTVYSATKITLAFKELVEDNPTFPQAVFTYHLADPTVVFFSDIALTQPIGEISLLEPEYQSKK